MHRKIILIFIISCVACCLLVASDRITADPPYGDGDKVIILGDRYTSAGLWPLYVAGFYATRYPKRSVQFFICNQNGDNLAQLSDRVINDIVILRPSAAVIAFGADELSRHLYAPFQRPDQTLNANRREDLDGYKERLEILIRKLRTRSLGRILVCSPQIYDLSTHNSGQIEFPGYNEALLKCSKICETLATRLQLGFVDVHGPLTNILLNADSKGGDSEFFSHDRLSLTPAGHLLMAWQFLKAQGVPGSVSNIVLNLEQRSSSGSRGVKLKDQIWTNNGWSSVVIEDCLPWALDPEAETALAWAPIVQELNQQMIFFRGLSPGNYKLTIDDMQIGIWSENDFSKGINLALVSETPQRLQAEAVQQLCEEHFSIYRSILNLNKIENEWFKSKINVTDEPAWSRALDQFIEANGSQQIHRQMAASYRMTKPQEFSIRKLLQDLPGIISEASQPKPHSYKISLVSD